MKKLRYFFIALVGLLLYTLVLAAAYRNIYLAPDGGQRRFGALVGPLKFVSEIPSMVGKFLEKDEFMETNSISRDGVAYYNSPEKGSYPKLLATYKTEKFGQKFDLLDLNTGRLIKQWNPDNARLFAMAYNEDNPGKPMKGSDLYFMHPLMTPDSSLLFTSQLTSLMAKIDPNSELVWLNNDKTYHHTLELDHEGNVYACTRPFKANKYSFFPDTYEQYSSTLRDDHIAKIDPATGDTLYEKSVLEILVVNGYKDLVLYKGQFTSDPIHLNDVQPALYDTEFWQKGDLLVSCRNLSVVFLYRPETNKILWLQHGPWYTQHDADFHEDSKVVVFGNDVLRDESRIDPPVSGEALAFTPDRPHNEVYVYDFRTDSTTTPFHELMKAEKIKTVTSGRCDILANGELFVEETNYGRIVIGDSVNKKIEYVKRLDDQNISRLFWSRIVE